MNSAVKSQCDKKEIKKALIVEESEETKEKEKTSRGKRGDQLSFQRGLRSGVKSFFVSGERPLSAYRASRESGFFLKRFETLEHER